MEIKEIRLEIYVPEEFVERIRDALADVGACKIGEYSHVVSCQNTKGYWKPLEGSSPYNGEKGKICSGSEVKMEVRCPLENVKQALYTIKEIHPYEKPVINIIPLLNGVLPFA